MSKEGEGGCGHHKYVVDGHEKLSARVLALEQTAAKNSTLIETLVKQIDKLVLSIDKMCESISNKMQVQENDITELCKYDAQAEVRTKALENKYDKLEKILYVVAGTIIATVGKYVFDKITKGV